VFVGAAGSNHAAFQRALRAGNLTGALVEARDLHQVNLDDALSLLLLVRDKRPGLYGRAAARWLARYCGDQPDVDLREAMLVAGALSALEGEDERPALIAIAVLARARRLRAVEKVARARLDRIGRGSSVTDEV
jgi:hypothetical protein